MKLNNERQLYISYNFHRDKIRICYSNNCVGNYYERKRISRYNQYYSDNYKDIQEFFGGK